ncbi:MAG TPA: hypothetical protein VKZ57_02650 [Sphingobacterium sp.]|nr:hypothetical protein [Sphingobacterium sp.]
MDFIYTIEDTVSFNTMYGQQTGESLTVKGYPKILFVAVRDGLMMRLYEHVSGLEVFSCEAFTIEELMVELTRKGRGLNHELLYSKLISEQAVIGFRQTNTPMRVRNTNRLFEAWNVEQSVVKENLPYVYTDGDRKEICNLIGEAKEKGHIEFAEFLERQVCRKKIDEKTHVTSVQNLKDSLRFIEQQEHLKKLRMEEKPYPIDHHEKKRDATFYGFKSLMNESRKRDITKNLPSDIFTLLYGAYFLTTLVNNAYGYHCRKLPYLTGIIMGIKKRNRGVNEARIDEYKNELADYIKSFKGFSISLIWGNRETPVLMVKSVTKKVKA